MAGRGNNGGRRGHRRIIRLILVPDREGDQSVVVVVFRVGVESELRVQLDYGVSVPLNLSVHSSTGRNGNSELGETSRDINGLGRRAVGQGDLGRRGSHHDGENAVSQELVAGRLSKGVRRSGGFLGVRPSPQIQLVLRNLRVGSGLEGVGVVTSHVQPCSMVKTVDPILAIGLITLDGTDVVGLSVVVPGNDLYYVELVAMFDDGLPAFVIQVIVRHVNPLKQTAGSERYVAKISRYIRSC